MRFLDMNDLLAIKRMTIVEYSLRMEVFRLKQVDSEFNMHLQAWLNHQVTAEKKDGKKTKPYFKNFDDFFDYEKRLKDVGHEKVKTDVDDRAKLLHQALNNKVREEE